MCGIAGYINKKHSTDVYSYLQLAIKQLALRGPDLQQAVRLSDTVGFAHARLSIIDTTTGGSQPMADSSGRHTIIFNGEIFNYRELRQQFLANVQFHSTSDTEVLLYLYLKLGKDCLMHLNGFFAFAIYDNQTEETFIARDRYGIKPLHIYANEEMVVFASELKAIMQFPIKKEIDFNTLALYLQLNYTPVNSSIIKNITKLPLGTYAIVNRQGQVQYNTYYTVPYTPGKHIAANTTNYNSATVKLKKLVEDAVKRRLVSDVPLGTFLSGGIDSSIVTYCAAKHVKGLNTFSIGYKDEPFFDETQYANLVAKKFNTNHTVFSISNNEMFSHIFDVLNYIDEPFADSSAIAVYILSYHTRQKVTVALSGDGGDELFAGYNKHKAELKARKKSVINDLLKASAPALGMLPQSRHSKYGNLFRQAHRYAQGLRLSPADRYWRWCVIQQQDDVMQLFNNRSKVNEIEVDRRKKEVTDLVKVNGELNDSLYADTQMVLPADMLTKVDLMSMANSLEVRVPLLDYTVVDYAFSLPVSYKIDNTAGKKILKDAFRDVLPPELFTRPKHGFEVPMLKWMRTGLRSLIEDDLLSKKYVEQQGIFNVDRVEELKLKLHSNNPGDVHAVLWGLIVFQYWYKRYM